MTTAAAPGRSSSGRKSRPSSGFCPISVKLLADWYGPWNRSGVRPSSLTFMVWPLYAASPENVRVAARQSTKS